MKYVNEIIIPAGMCLVAIAIIVIMRGVLNFVIGVPLWMIGIVLVVGGTLTFIPSNMIIQYYRYGKEGFIFMRARKEGLIVIDDVEIGTNNAEFMIGEKDDPKSPVFKDEASGVRFDPSMASKYAEPKRYPGGLNIVGFAHHSPLPQNTKNHLAFKAIIDYFHEGERTPDKPDPKDPNKVIRHPAKVLAFLPDKEKIELLDEAEHFLEADITTKVGKYFKPRKGDGGQTVYHHQYQKDGKWFEMVVEIPELIHAVQQLRADVSKLPIHEGFFSGTEAFVYNDIPYTSQYVANLKSWLVQMVNNNWLKKINLMHYGIIAMGIIGVLTIAIYVLHNMVFAK